MLKIVFRSLFRQKVYAVVIILSLAIGLSFANILVAFIVRETSTDSFFTQKDRIYRLLSDDPFGNRSSISFILENTSQYIAQHFPEVEKLSRVFDLNGEGVTLKRATSFYPEIMTLGVDSTFFEIFDFSFYEGNPQQALQPNAVVLTRKTAKKIWGHENAVGETITLVRDTVQKQLQVMGVIDDLTENSHLQFDALVLYPSFENKSGGATNYVLLNPQANPKQLAEKISQNAEVPGLMGPGKLAYFFQPLPEVYFDTENTRSYPPGAEVISVPLIFPSLHAGAKVAFIWLLPKSFNL